MTFFVTSADRNGERDDLKLFHSQHFSAARRRENYLGKTAYSAFSLHFLFFLALSGGDYFSF